MITLSNTGNKPEASITVNKSRRKTYSDKEGSKNKVNNLVYLNDGEKFEIELYNPTSEEVAAQILINGDNIHEAGFILKPNERVFLERYIDKDKSFIFETLDVKGSEKEMGKLQKLLKNTGTVKITFHKKIEEKSLLDNYRVIEKHYHHDYYYHRRWYDYPYWGWNNQPIWCSAVNNNIDLQDVKFTSSLGQSTSLGMGASLTCNNNLASGNNNGLLSCNAGDTSSGANISFNNPTKNEKSESIGMIGEGEETGQEINHSTSTSKFNIESFYTVTYKLLSSKDKPIESSEIRNYCNECGLKLKNEYKFCPKCGSKKV